MTDTLEKPLAGAATAGDVERVLLARFPRGQAEEWDRCGLLVGDPAAPATKVAVGLDASSANVRFAAEQGCNVLLTHHPAFLDPPSVFGPQARGVADAGTAVWEACRSGVALINFHTCLDRALVAQQQLPQLLGLDYEHPLEGWAALRASRGSQAVPSPGTPAYGAVCRAPGGMTVRELAERCGRVMGGRSPRVWGDPDAPVIRAATCTGSLGDLGQEALSAGLDAVVAGEVRYHSAIDLAARGLALIELGHDASEQPLTACLMQALTDEGFPRDRIVLIDQPHTWLSL